MSKKLTRSISDKMIAGVASGLADYFQLDVTWVRIAFVLAAFFGGGGLWIYIILWIAVPKSNILFSYGAKTDMDFQTIKEKSSSKVNGNLIGGLALIILGSYFLLDEFDVIPEWFRIGKLWPLVFVAIGLTVLFKGAKQESEVKDFDTSEFKKSTHGKVEDVVEKPDEDINKNDINPL